MDSEIWKPIEGFEGYEVSSAGRVRSVDRIIKCANRFFVHKKGGIRKPYRNPINGYMTICLRRDNKSWPKYVHRLVATAFLPNPERLREVNHKD